MLYIKSEKSPKITIMKKNIIKITLLFLPFFGFSQMGASVVFDPTAATNMSTQIANTTQQIGQLEQSLQYMQKASETLSKVNGYVRDVSSLTEISQMYRESISLANRVRTNAQAIKNPANKKRVLTNVSQLLTSLSTGIDFVTKIVSNDFFQMSDKERLDLLTTERRKVLIKRSKLTGYLN